MNTGKVTLNIVWLTKEQPSVCNPIMLLKMHHSLWTLICGTEMDLMLQQIATHGNRDTRAITAAFSKGRACFLSSLNNTKGNSAIG